MLLPVKRTRFRFLTSLFENGIIKISCMLFQDVSFSESFSSKQKGVFMFAAALATPFSAGISASAEEVMTYAEQVAEADGVFDNLPVAGASANLSPFQVTLSQNEPLFLRKNWLRAMFTSTPRFISTGTTPSVPVHSCCPTMPLTPSTFILITASISERLVMRKTALIAAVLIPPVIRNFVWAVPSSTAKNKTFLHRLVLAFWGIPSMNA